MTLRGKVEIAGITDTGLVRERNEDSILTHPDIGLAVLADGMGGHRGGDVASALAVRTIHSVLKALLPELRSGYNDEETGYALQSTAVHRAVEMANESVYEAAQQQPELQGMGTTVVVLLFHDNRVTIAHIGDSRLYRVRGGELEQVTRDHTLLQDLIDRGFYTPEEARCSKNKNLVTRALGIEQRVHADIQEERVARGDLFMLCSDGLNDMVEDDEIHHTLDRHGEDLQQAAEQLVCLANQNGGRDNVSVVLGRALKPFPARKSWVSTVVDWF